MCPDVADKADSGTKNSVAVRALKIRINCRACFHSTGFEEQSPFYFLRLVPHSGARLSQDSLLISKAFREDLRESL